MSDSPVVFNSATAAPAPRELPPAPPAGTFLGTGRRKCAVARVRLTAGSGKFMINERPVDKYFHEIAELEAVREPLGITSTLEKVDVHVKVHGGGHAGQAGAVKLGVARALVAADKRFEPFLRDRSLLTRDSRIVERKKYGRRKARRRFQFSKR